MKLYLITRRAETDYDQFNGFVVAAPSPTKARQLCQDYDSEDHSLDEDGNRLNGTTWTKASSSSWTLIAQETHLPAGIVLADFFAG